MNKVILCGRVCRDPEVRYTTGAKETCIAKYSLAVDRRTKEKETDFINCVAFGKSGEFAEKYLKKGTKILVVGRIQTGSYTDKEGRKVYTTDIVVEEHEFCESKGTEQPAPPSGSADGFMNIPDAVDDGELPFN